MNDIFRIVLFVAMVCFVGYNLSNTCSTGCDGDYFLTTPAAMMIR